MKLVKGTYEVQSEGLHPTFHNVTPKVKELVKASNIKDGVCNSLFTPYNLFNPDSGTISRFHIFRIGIFATRLV